MKEVLITSSVLIGILLLLRLLFAKRVSRRLIYSVWLLVALRLLIPVQIGQAGFSVLTMTQPLTETVTEIGGLRVIGQNETDASQKVIGQYIEKDQTVFTPQVQQRIQSAEQDEMSREEIAVMINKVYSNQEIFVPEVQQQVAQQVQEQTDFVSLRQAATVIWIFGMATMSVWFAVVNLRYSRMLRHNRQHLTCNSPIPVFVLDKVASPCLVGLFRPTVYLTPRCADEAKLQHYVLTHELTHYRHGDHIWSLVRCICLCVYWFDPLVWIAAYVSRRDCELACDEGALQRLGEADRVAYGSTLLEVVSHAATRVNLLQAATAMAETKKQLKERVSFIVKKRKISITAAICMVLICTMVVGCVAVGPSDGQNIQSNPSEQPSSTQTTPTSVPTVPTTEPTQPTKTPVSYKWCGILCSYVTGYDEWPLVIRSVEEMKIFETIEIGYDSSSVPADLSAYDAAFFESKTLIVCSFDSIWWPCDFEVTSFFRIGDDGYYLSVRDQRHGQRFDDPCCTLLLLEVPEIISEDADIELVVDASSTEVAESLDFEYHTGLFDLVRGDLEWPRVVISTVEGLQELDKIEIRERDGWDAAFTFEQYDEAFITEKSLILFRDKSSIVGLRPVVYSVSRMADGSYAVEYEYKGGGYGDGFTYFYYFWVIEVDGKIPEDAVFTFVDRKAYR